MKTCKIFLISSEKESSSICLEQFDDPKISEFLKFGSEELKTDVSNMLKFDLIVTIGNWFESEDAKKAVEIARLMELKVIHESNFKNYVEQNYN